MVRIGWSMNHGIGKLCQLRRDSPRETMSTISRVAPMEQKSVTLAAYLAGRGIDVNASGVTRELDGLKLQLADSRNYYHPRSTRSRR